MLAFTACTLAGFLSKPPTSTAACQQSLQSDLAELFSGGLYSDVVIAVGGREFPAHRGVLAARSAFFRAMFAAQMRESQTGKVLLDDVEPRVFSHVLKYGGLRCCCLGWPHG